MRHIADEWLERTETQKLFEALEEAGHSAFAVGGCVRDSLLGRPTNDIDIATDADPDRVTEVCQSHHFQVVPTGYEHGTVTVVIDDAPYEVTTFRRDVETDGRRATIAFASSIEEDALRRDFTMNALYADRTGLVYDPIGGLPDLEEGRIRFIEDPVRRIREDYLRSLRFFRFHAWFGDKEKGFDQEALAAIASNLGGLAKLSRERIGSEIIKLLGAPDPVFAVAGMRATGVLASVLPGADDASLARLVHLEAKLSFKPRAMRRLAVLGGEDVATLLRLSRKQTQYLSTVRNAVTLSPEETGYQFGEDVACDALLIRAASSGSDLDPGDLRTAEFAARQKFPLAAADLMPGIQGVELGKTLKRLEHEWVRSGFRLTRSQLLARISKEG